MLYDLGQPLNLEWEERGSLKDHFMHCHGLYQKIAGEAKSRAYFKLIIALWILLHFRS